MTIARLLKTMLTVATAALAAGCSGDDGGTAASPTPTDEAQGERGAITLYVDVPRSEATRVGDPGATTAEGVSWDRLTILIAYPEANSEGGYIYSQTITSEEFYALPIIAESLPDTLRAYTMYAPTGTAYIYGLTYSSDAAGDLLATLNACASNADVKAATISNDYAAGDANRTAKFISVATGYYKDDLGHQASLNITADPEFTAQSRALRLYRLAAQIDVQWDAANAYPKYSDVEVNSFTFYGAQNASTSGGTGSGRLFPELVDAGAEALGGTSEFTNTTEISRRNGRIYHYVFPDGVGQPKITFNISWLVSGDAAPTTSSYTLNFNTGTAAVALQRATWYKINMTVSGNSSAATLNIGAASTTGN